MNNDFSSIGRILVGPWQQRRNQGGLWGLGLIALLSTLVVAVVAMVNSGSARGYAAITVPVLGPLWMLGAWALLVLNVLEQNHPTFARLLPRQVGRLRVTLVAAWATAVGLAAMAAACIGLPALAWATATAAGLLALAAALRWPLLWLLGCLSPFFTLRAQQMAWVHGAIDAVAAIWQAGDWAIALAVAGGGAVFLAALVRHGDARHAASYLARKDNNLRYQRCAAGADPLVPADGVAGWATRLRAISYAAWMRRLLARPDTSPMSRMLLGLGPAAHWTTRVLGALTTLTICLFVVAFSQASAFAPYMAGALGGLSLGAVAGIVIPTLQGSARLHQMQREQALLALLPGVRRQGALNRWLSGYLSLQFVASWLVALALAVLLERVALALVPGHSGKDIGDGRGLVQAALIPLLALQWRPWARMRAPTQLNSMLPYLLGVALAALTWGLKRLTGLGYLEIGTLYALASLAWFAVRWRRMGREPSAFPVGRLAR